MCSSDLPNGIAACDVEREACAARGLGHLGKTSATGHDNRPVSSGGEYAGQFHRAGVGGSGLQRGNHDEGGERPRGRLLRDLM